jgi:tetratricopeptide (TPR) repeat protein
MVRRAAIWILAAAALLTGSTGCGTRTIIVPLNRPARINLHATGAVILPPTEAADGTPLSREIAVHLDALLPALLSDSALHIRSFGGDVSVPRLFTTDGGISRKALQWWNTADDAALMLVCIIVRGDITEQVATATRYSEEHGQGKWDEKEVRREFAQASCRVFLIDLRREALLLDDTLSDSGLYTGAQNIARRFATAIADASRPIRLRNVVTFLVDDAYPEIETAIAHAEEGRWHIATRLLQRLAAEAEGRENADVIWYDLGMSLQYERDFQGALHAFDRAIAIRDRGRYRHARAALLQAEEEYLDDLQRR